MTYEEIATFMNGLLGDDKCAYFSFPEMEAPDLPYVLFYYPSESHEMADDGIHAKIAHINVELYTAKKDIELETEIEMKLEHACMIYEKTSEYIKEENMFLTLYEMEEVINGEN